MENYEEVANIVSTERGKPITEALGVELIPSLDFLKFLRKNAGNILSEFKSEYHQLLFAHKKGRIIIEPIGTILNISPWNKIAKHPIPDDVQKILGEDFARLIAFEDKKTILA